MSNVAKLKKKAAEFEEKRQFDRALSTYEQVISQIGDGDEEIDIALFNRVGDLALRQGNVTQAVSYYERAVDLYAERGFFNNAIALCNKILRNAPGRTEIYHKLGRISARKGFTSDAKQNFLEYADRMQKSGHWEEAFAALKEFADLCPDQDDVRLMLAEQLTRKDRRTEAMEQLQILYARYLSEDRNTEANATLDRMRTIDPDVVPQVSVETRTEKRSDLVFLDLSEEEGGYGEEDDLHQSGPRRASISDPAGHETLPPGHDWSTPADTRISGAMRSLTPPAGFETTGLGPGTGAEALGEELPDLTLEPTIIEMDSASGDLPSHDLALAGILPQLNTPGLSAPVQEELLEELELEEESTGDQLDGLLSPFERQAREDAGLAVEDATVQMPDIEPRGDESIDIGVGTDSNLGVVHGAGPGRVGGAGDVGAESLLTDRIRRTPVSNALELVSALSRDSIKSIAESAEELDALLAEDPDDHAIRRRLGEVLVEDGRREEGLGQLDTAMNGFDAAGQIGEALSIADEILRVEPNSVRHHQKRVEYAYRTNDQPLLVDAYIELADALFRSSEVGKARAVYERVLELAPGSSRALAAIAAISVGGDEPPAAESSDDLVDVGAGGGDGSDSGSFVDLGELLREDEAPPSTRMVVEEEAPSGDEQADFAEMLDKFKRGLAQNVDAEDYESHYDLGVAFKEMGLLDEAIAQFQRALRGTTNKIRTYEALGQCFVERSQFPVASNILKRALSDGAADEQLVGVLYLLGYSAEAQELYREALEYYQRVFMVDIQFRDVTERISALEKVAK